MYVFLLYHTVHFRAPLKLQDNFKKFTNKTHAYIKVAIYIHKTTYANFKKYLAIAVKSVKAITSKYDYSVREHLPLFYGHIS